VPLPLPVLDDRRFAALVAEARTLIPTHAPEWTNHNPSDPGITLIELLAHLSEMLIYRLDRVTTANVAAFLTLLDGRVRTSADLEGMDLGAEVRATILGLRTLDRAVAAADFELLALQADPRIERARAVPRRNLAMDLDRDRAGHVSVIVLATAAAEPLPVDFMATVQAYLQPRVLLTTRVHVVPPSYTDVTVKATVVPLPDQRVEGVKAAVVHSVSAFLDPHEGGEDGRGWPFGRNVFASEIYALLDRLPEVDYVTALTLSPVPAGRLLVGGGGELIGVELKPHELVRAHIAGADVTVVAE